MLSQMLLVRVYEFLTFRSFNISPFCKLKFNLGGARVLSGKKSHIFNVLITDKSSHRNYDFGFKFAKSVFKYAKSIPVSKYVGEIYYFVEGKQLETIYWYTSIL